MGSKNNKNDMLGPRVKFTADSCDIFAFRRKQTKGKGVVGCGDPQVYVYDILRKYTPAR